MKNILDAELICEMCKTVSRVSDCEPDVDGDGSLGCPLPDCGGVMRERKPAEREEGR